MSGKYKSDCYAVQLHSKSMTYLTLYDIAHAMVLLHELSLLETVNAALRAQLERCYKGMFMFCSIPDTDLFNDINRNTSDRQTVLKMNLFCKSESR